MDIHWGTDRPVNRAGGDQQPIRSKVPPGDDVSSQPRQSPHRIALQLDGITKHFGQTVALDNASLTVAEGTVHALLGENGAGKTTLMHIAFGMSPPDAGTIRIREQSYRLASPSDAIAAGLGMVHQHFMLVPAMTVAENIALGGRGRRSLAQESQRVQTISKRYGLPIDPNATVGSLPVGAQQRVEILKAFAHEASILILDEPTAVLTVQESRELLQQLRQFVDHGGTVILITHKLRDALEFADDVTVLRRGRTVLTAPAIQVDEQGLANAMLGTSHATADHAPILGAAVSDHISRSPDAAHSDSRIEVLELAGIAYRDSQGIERLSDISLSVASGEILGVAAVEGNGQHELLRILAGRLRPTAGTCRIPDRVGFVPEDRHRDALILEYSLTENVELANVGARRGRIHWSESRARTEALIRTYAVRAPSAQIPARALSGGNQQKLVVGRELHVGDRALILENPTRGLDIQATADIHQHIRAARSHGAALVMYSSDLDEILALADRVVVLYEGRLMAPPLDREAIGRSMLGLSG